MACPICLEQTCNKITIQIPCCTTRHEFCLSCFINLKQKSCPLCRRDFESFIPLIEEGALETLLEYLTNYNIHKPKKLSA